MAQAFSCSSIVSDGTSARCQRLPVCNNFRSLPCRRHVFQKQGTQRTHSASRNVVTRAAALPDLEERLSRYEWDQMRLPDLTGACPHNSCTGSECLSKAVSHHSDIIIIFTQSVHLLLSLFSGKTVIVTGGNSGIGFASCLALAKQNANVILASRDRQRGET